MSNNENSNPFPEGEPILVDVYFRIDGDSDGREVFINYEVSKVADWVNGSAAVIRGERIILKPQDVDWLTDCTWNRGGYWNISGFGIERNGKHVPLLDQAFDFGEPLTLITVRKQKELGSMRFEDYDSPCRGLHVWVQKKSGDSTNVPKPKSIDLPVLELIEKPK